MTLDPTPLRVRTARWPQLNIGRMRGFLVAFGVFAVLFATANILSASPLTYFDYLYISSGGLTLAITAAGATIVILTGGFDLSAAAIVTLINVLVATSLGDGALSQVGVAVLGVAVGAVCGAVNGYFVAVQRLQSIVVTLATMFTINGLARSGGCRRPADTFRPGSPTSSSAA